MASVVLVVISLGALRYQYYAVAQGQLARAQIAATHTAHLLLEDWKSTGGATDYNPSRLGLGFSAPQSLPAGFTTPEGLGNTLNEAAYTLEQNGTTLTVALKYKNVSQDTGAETTLRQLAVVARFAQAGEHDANSRLTGLPPITLVTYVRLDATNG